MECLHLGALSVVSPELEATAHTGAQRLTDRLNEEIHHGITGCLSNLEVELDVQVDITRFIVYSTCHLRHELTEAVPGFTALVPTGKVPTMLLPAEGDLLSVQADTQGGRLIQELVSGDISYSSFSSQWQTVLRHREDDQPDPRSKYENDGRFRP